MVAHVPSWVASLKVQKKLAFQIIRFSDNGHLYADEGEVLVRVATFIKVHQLRRLETFENKYPTYLV